MSLLDQVIFGQVTELEQILVSTTSRSANLNIIENWAGTSLLQVTVK